MDRGTVEENGRVSSNGTVAFILTCLLACLLRGGGGSMVDEGRNQQETKVSTPLSQRKNVKIQPNLFLRIHCFQFGWFG